MTISTTAEIPVAPQPQPRARGLYDEQLQRVQQERALSREAGKAPSPEQ